MSGVSNPAGRLLEILLTARQQNQELPASDVWTAVFALPSKSVPQLLQCGVELCALAAETRARVSAIPDEDGELALEQFGQVEATVANFGLIGVGMPMRQFMQHLQETGIYSLKMCASMLRRRDSEPTMAPDMIDSLLSQVRELLDQVRKATDLDMGAKRWLIDRLSGIESALALANITGLPRIERESDALMGGLRRHPSIMTRIRSSEIVVNLAALVLALDTGLNVAANLLTLEAAQAESRPSVVVVEILEAAKCPLELSPPSDVPQAARASVNSERG